MANRIGKSQILKNLRAKYLKGGISEKRELASEAGSRGFSNLQMEKKLKEMGYDPARRRAVINHIVGDKKLERADIPYLTKEEIKKLPYLERVKVNKILAGIKARNIASQADPETYEKEKGAWYSAEQQAKRKVKNIETGSSGEEVLNVGGVSKAIGHFAGGDVSANKNSAPNNAVSITSGQGGGVTNQLNNKPGPNSGISTIPLSSQPRKAA